MRAGKTKGCGIKRILAIYNEKDPQFTLVLVFELKLKRKEPEEISASS